MYSVQFSKRTLIEGAIDGEPLNTSVGLLEGCAEGYADEEMGALEGTKLGAGVEGLLEGAIVVDEKAKLTSLGAAVAAVGVVVLIEGEVVSQLHLQGHSLTTIC